MLTRLVLVFIVSGLWTTAGTSKDARKSISTSPEAMTRYGSSVDTLLDSLRRSRTAQDQTTLTLGRGRRGARKGKNIYDDRGVYRLTSIEPAFPMCRRSRHVSWTTWRNETYAVCISTQGTASIGRLKVTGWSALDEWTVADGQQSVTFQYNDVVYAVVADKAKVDGTDLLRFNANQSRMEVDHTIHSRYATAVTLWRMNADEENFHLAIANSHGSDSDVFLDFTYTYEWRETYFDHYDSVQSYDVRDLESFHIYGHAYLVVANHKTDKENYDVDSEIFRFDVEQWGWKSFQKVRTQAVSDAHFFQLGPENAPDYFLVFANQFEIRNGHRNYAVSSVIHKFVGDRFVPFQCLQTHGAKGVSAYTDPLTGAFLLAFSNSFSPVQLFQYDGWNFVLTPVQSTTESMAPGAEGLVFHPWNGFQSPANQLALVVSNPRKELESSVFALSFVSESPIRQWYSDGLRWCKQAEERFNLTRPSEMVKVLDDAYRSDTDQPIKLDRPVIFQGGLTIRQSLQAPKVVDLHADRVLDYTLLFQLHLLEQRLHAVRNRMEHLKSALKMAVRTFGTHTITGHLEFDSISASCNNANCKIPSIETKFLNEQNIEGLRSKVLFLDQPNTVLGSLKFEELHVEGELTVSGLVDGVNTSHVVTRDSNKLIHTEKTFAHTLVATNINIQGKLDGVRVDPETILLTQGDQEVHGEVTFTEVELQDIHVEGLVGGVNLHEFYEDVVVIGGGVQRVTGPKTLKGPVTLRDLHLETGKVNGLDLVDLWNKAVWLDGDQEIHALWNFSRLSLVNPRTASVNGIQIPGPGIVITPGEGDLLITEHQRFKGKVIVDSLEIEESLNGLRKIQGGTNECPNQLDLVLRSCDQTISGSKQFVSLTLGSSNFVKGNINNFNLKLLEDKLNHRILNLTENWVLNQVEIRAPVLVKEDLVGWEVEQLYHRALKLDQPLPQNAEVQFKNKVQVERLICEDLNGVNVDRDLILRHGPAVVKSRKQWENMLLLEDSKVVGKVNGMDLSFLDDVLRNVAHVQVLHETRIVEGDLTVSSLELGGSLSGLDMSKAVRLGNTLTFNVPVSLQDVVVNSDLLVGSVVVKSGIVNGHNFQQLLNDTMLYNLPQRVTGRKVVTGDLIVPEGSDLKVGLVNGLDLDSLQRDTVYRDQMQHITGPKTFVKPVRFHDLVVNGSIGGVSVWHMFNNWMLQGAAQTVTGDMTFNGDLKVEGDVSVGGLVNGIDLETLQKDIIRNTQPFESIGDLNLKQAVVQGDLAVFGTVQDVDLSEEAVQVLTDNVIQGRKIFRNMLIDGDLIVGSINAVNVEELCLNTARRIEPLSLDQVVVRGDLSVSGDVHTQGPVNGILLEEFRRSVVMLNESHIFDNVVFNEVIFQQPVILEGSLNGIDLLHLGQNYMSLSRDQDVSSEMVFKGPITIEGIVHVGYLKTADDMVGTVNVRHLAQNVLTTHSRQEVPEKMVIRGNLHFRRNLTVSSSFNGLSLPGDIGLKSRPNVVQGPVVFTSDLVVTVDLDLLDEVAVQGIDVSEWALQSVMTTGYFTLTGVKKFNDLRVHDVRAMDIFGGTSISESTILLKKRKQVVKGKVSFGGKVNVRGSLNTTSQINGVQVPKLLTESVLKNRPAIITGRKVFLRPLRIKRLYTTGFVASVNLTELSLLIKRPYDLEVLNMQLVENCRSVSNFESFLADTPQKLNYYDRKWARMDGKSPSTIQAWDVLPLNASMNLLIFSLKDGKDCSSIHINAVTENKVSEIAVLRKINAIAVKTFLVGHTPLLAVSNVQNHCTSEPDGVLVFSMDPFSRVWGPRQELTRLVARDIDSLKSDSGPCLASAVQDQVLVHCFNPQTDSLELKQTISLEGVHKVCFASCREGVFLAASSLENGVWSVHVFAWSGQSLVQVQTISTYYPAAGPVLVDSTDKAGHPVCMLVIAEGSFDKRITFPTSVYSFNMAAAKFVESHQLSTRGVLGVHWSRLDSGDLLLYLLTLDGVHVYAWTGQSGFAFYDFFHVPGGRSMLGFGGRGSHHLAVSGLSCGASCWQTGATEDTIFKAKIKGL